MIASVALRPKCCHWHAHTAAASEHAACVICDRPMPLVKASFNGWPPEHICPRCRIDLAANMLRIEAIRRARRRSTQSNRSR